MSDFRKIKLFYSNHGNNFGDCLSPIICEKLSGQEIHFHSVKKSNFFAIGSILHRLNNEFWRIRKNIWGSGHISEVERYKSPHNFYALRGKKSAYLIRNSAPESLGDPGLLVDLVLPEYRLIKKKYQLGIIPHHVDQNNLELLATLKKHPKIMFIDIRTAPLEFLKQVASCEVILSSSLHGLIAADSFGIPNKWLKISNNLIGADFKFNDYYSAFDIKTEPIYLSNICSDTTKMVCDEFYRPGIDQIKSDLIKSFPKKFLESHNLHTE